MTTLHPPSALPARRSITDTARVATCDKAITLAVAGRNRPSVGPAMVRQLLTAARGPAERAISQLTKKWGPPASV